MPSVPLCFGSSSDGKSVVLYGCGVDIGASLGVGATGAAGENGMDGENGATGATGAAGENGTAGATGATGSADSALNVCWGLTGNAGTTNSEFIGTTDNNPLTVRVNNVPSLIIKTGNRLDVPSTALNLFIGDGAGDLNESNNNTAVGAKALSQSSGTLANSNTAVGAASLYTNTAGADNTAVGALSLYSNTSGSTNTAVGVSASAANSTGNGNTAVGYLALNKNESGNSTAIGANALKVNVNGINTAVGCSSLSALVSGSGNTAVGYYTLAGNETGQNNTAVGLQALYLNTANSNTAVGKFSLEQNITGENNTAVGTNSIALSTGTNNVAIGSNTSIPTPLPVGAIQNNNILIGSYASVISLSGTGFPADTVHGQFVLGSVASPVMTATTPGTAATATYLVIVVNGLQYRIEMTGMA